MPKPTQWALSITQLHVYFEEVAAIMRNRVMRSFGCSGYYDRS
jgi:hypothetical protein